jgi:transposase
MRFRLQPAPTHDQALLEHSAHVRFIWNLAVEQQRHWRPGRASAPGYTEQSRQLTEARREFPWLAAGSQTVRQQALRDFAQAMSNFFAGTHGRPTCRKAGRHEGFRIVGRRGQRWDTRRMPRKVGAALSTGDLLMAPGLRMTEEKRLLCKDWIETISTDLARRFDVIRVEDLKIRNLVRSARGTREFPGRNVRAKAGLNRSIHAAGWGRLVTRLEEKAPGRVEKIKPAYTSQTCNACGHCDPKNRESQAVFRCRVCEHLDHADVNAAKNIAAGRAVTARGGRPVGRSVNREPNSLSPLHRERVEIPRLVQPGEDVKL